MEQTANNINHNMTYKIIEEEEVKQKVRQYEEVEQQDAAVKQEDE